MSTIVQLIADNEKLKHLSKNLLRSDADYFILAEARDGIALDTAVKIASKGTRRMKITFHTRDPLDFSYDVAFEIVKSMGGNLDSTARKVASSFDYIFHFIQLKNKNQKRLKSIYELGLDRDTREISVREICRYEHRSDDWKWEYAVSEDKLIIGEEENPEILEVFLKELKMLSAGGKGGKGDAVLHGFSDRRLDGLFRSGEKPVGEDQDAQPAESQAKGSKAGKRP